MRSFSSVVVAALALFAAAPSLGAPTTQLLTVEKASNGKAKEGSYIILLKDGVQKDAHISSLSSNSKITHNWRSDFVHGYAGAFSEDDLKELRASPDILSIAEDPIMHTMATTTEDDAPWGISRISQDGKVSGTAGDLDFTYKYNDKAGEGVDIYIVDTGINTEHEEFDGRATWGKTFGGYDDADGNGHGTHCAGTAAGKQFGVAKKANLIAVKILSDEGSGSTSDIVSGLEWVADQADSSGNPTVASMSLGGSASTSLDNAVKALTDAGVHVTVAAGNDGGDAGSTSPAREKSALTIGATNIDDEISSFSNYGSVVDLFAPGEDITSAWKGSSTATNTISGTSMATPHVAGLVAYTISVSGNVSPAELATALKSQSVKDAIDGVPSGTLNDLARNDI